MKRYALLLKRGSLNDITCLSKTKEELEVEIDIAYWNWKACKSKDASEEAKTKTFFLEIYKRIELTIKEIE